MLKLHNVVCLFVHFCGYILPAKAIPCRGTATYKLQFQAEWKNTSSRPAGAKFSGLIGCVHNKCYQMWKEGERASRGVKNVAEKGDTRELEEEIKKLVGNRTTFPAFTLNTLSPERVSTVTEFLNVDSVRPLVTVIAKISPSPDWFIGVYDVDLCDRETGTWVKVKQVAPVYPYDAGTDSGTQFTSIDSPSSSRGDIARIRGQALAPWTKEGRGLGLFHFAKESFSGQTGKTTDSGEFQSDETIECPNEASQKHLSCIFIFSSLVAALNIL